MQSRRASSQTGRGAGAELRHIASAAAIGSFCLAASVLAAFAAYAGLRPIEPPGADNGHLAKGLVACPAAPAYADPARIQSDIENRRQAAADRVDAATGAERETLLRGLQIQICRLILQNPARSLAWAQLLPASDTLTNVPDQRAIVYNVSYDFGRLEQQAAYWRVVFGANHWTRLLPSERQRLLADAGMLARIHDQNYFVRHLASLAAIGGPDLTAAFRKAVMENAPEEARPEFDVYFRKASELGR